MGKILKNVNTISRLVVCCVVFQLFVKAEAQDRVTGRTFATRSYKGERSIMVVLLRATWCGTFAFTVRQRAAVHQSQG